MKELVQKNKGLFLKCLIWSFASGLFAHAYMYFNNSMTHDSVSEFAGSHVWKMQIGRIFVPFYQTYIRGSMIVPFFIGVLTLLYIGVAVFLIAKLFSAKSNLLIALISGVMAANITVIATTATFIGDLDCNMLGMLCAVIAVFCWRKFKFGFLFGAIPLVFTFGLYQSYVSVAVILIIFVLLFDLFEGKRFKEEFLSGLKGVAMIILAGVLYFIALKGVLAANHLDLSSGRPNSIDTAFSLSAVELLKNMWDATKVAVHTTFFPYSLFADGFNGTVHIVLAIVSAIAMITALVSKKIKWAEILLIAALIIVLPFGANFCHALANNISHELMYYSFNFFYVFALLITFKHTDLLKIGHVLKAVCVVLVAIVIFGNVRLANVTYMVKDQQSDAVLSYFTGVTSKMEEIEGYKEGQTKVCFFGADYQSLPWGFEDVTGMFGMSGGFLQNQDFYIYYYRYFQYYLMRNEWIVPQEDVKDMEFVNQMPSYPEDGCMQFVDDILVVKL